MGTNCRYDCMCVYFCIGDSPYSLHRILALLTSDFSINTWLSFSSDLPLKTYKRRRGDDTSSTGKSQIISSEHLLHTSAHSKIDYIAREEEGDGNGGLLSHYLGVYDPQSGQLQLVRARKLVLRSSLRSIPTEKEKTPRPTSVSNLSWGTWLSSHADQVSGSFRTQCPRPHLWH